jgi:hypothetical protein
MGYYENPPIIQPNRGSEIVSAAIVNAANSLSQGLLTAGERRRQEQKERRLTIQKLQDRKNETDLLYNEKQSDWALKQPKTNDAVDNKMRDIVRKKITLAADSQILLLNETDQKKRAQYLKNIRDANGFLDSSGSFAKSIAEQTATWRQGVKGASVGVPGGSVVNGKDEDEIIQNTAVLEILGGMTQGYTDTNIDINPDDNGDGVVMKVTGIDRDGNKIDRVINSKTFGKSEEEGGDGLLVPVESLDPFFTKAREEIIDKKGNLYSTYISQTRETVDILSKGDSGGGIGTDQYQIINGQRLDEKLIKSKIQEKSKITAAGILKADGPTRLRTLLDYSIGLQPGYYDKQFKTKTPTEQQQTLSDLLTNKSWEEMTKSLEQSKGENGETIYWNPTADVRIKDKETPKSDSTKEEKPEETTYKEENYDSIITGYTPSKDEDLQEGQIKYRTRKKLADNLNQLSGNAEGFITREELFKLYDQSVQSGKTTQKNVEFAKKKFGNAQLFKRDGKTHRPITKYNLNSAAGRVRLALDYTANESERKMLQGKLRSAKLKDWTEANPRKQNETIEQYSARANRYN